MSTFGAGISIAMLSGIVNAALPHVDREVLETQRLNRMPGNALLIDSGEDQDTTGNVYAWNIRLRDAAGTNQTLRPFQATQYSVGYYTERFTVPFRDKTNTAFAFDRLEIARNRAAPNRIYDLLKERRSAQIAAIADENEVAVFGSPDDASDESAIFGLECWARRSMDSTGAFVSLPGGGFNGTYWRGRQGAISASLGGVDCASLANERARNYCITVAPVMGPELIAAVKRAMDETMVDFVPGLTGATPGASEEAVIFWDPDYDSAYEELLAKGPDDRYRGGVGDYYPGASKRLKGCMCVRTPALIGKADRPIFGVRRSLVKVLKGRGMWMVDGDGVVPGAHNVVYKPRDWTWQMISRDLRRGAFRVHSSFTTGT